MHKEQADDGDIGPQYPRDNAFTRRMRFHQSWYRARVLQAPMGTGPKASNSTHYGNMLARQDGERGLNFLTPHIFAVAKRRLALKKGTLEPFRLLCNLLSSQPMCFNLFGPLVDDAELATRLMQVLLPGEVQSVSKVFLEYAPEPAKDYLNDLTAFDTFVAYQRPDGQPGFVGIETKLTEAFSPKVYTSKEYRHWFEQPGAPWPPDALPRLLESDVNQLWRDHLLAVAMKLAPKSRYTSGKLMLVYHPLDQECVTALQTYQTLLRPADDSFIAMPLDEMVRRWLAAVETPAQRQWLGEFSRRYLALEASEAEFVAQQQKSEG